MPLFKCRPDAVWLLPAQAQGPFWGEKPPRCLCAAGVWRHDENRWHGQVASLLFWVHVSGQHYSCVYDTHESSVCKSINQPGLRPAGRSHSGVPGAPG